MGSANPENIKAVTDLADNLAGMTQGQIDRAAARQAAKQALKATDKEARAALRNAMETPEGQAAITISHWGPRTTHLSRRPLRQAGT